MIAIVYAVNSELRTFPARLQDKLTASKPRTGPQLIPCDRIFSSELRIIKRSDIALQFWGIEILDRVFVEVLCYYRPQTLAQLGPNLPYALEVH